jgi:hypothetical protein
MKTLPVKYNVRPASSAPKEKGKDIPKFNNKKVK